MTYGRYPYGGVGYAGSDVDDIPQADTRTTLAVEVAFTTGALDPPVFVDITSDVRFWEVQRGRNRELERFQPGRATVVLGNLSRQYDSVNAAGPNFGNIKPMKRIRIRETFNGVTYPVFDGFVDRWQLDYPDKGKDATATLTATDGSKLLARSDLGLSVYDDQVLDDSPSVYLRLNEKLNTASDANLTAHNAGTVGAGANATYIGPPLKMGQEGLIVKDPGASIFTNQDTLGISVVLKMGATIPEAGFDLFDNLPFVLECWSLPIDDPIGTVLDDRLLGADTAADGWQWFYQESTDKYVFAVANDTPTTLSVTASATSSRNQRHHTVLKFVAGETLKQWVDGVLTSGSTLSGTFVNRQNDDVHIGHADTEPSNNNWVGNLSNWAIYTGANATAVDQAWVDRHYAAGTAPWNGDLPGARIGRALDEASWPATLRELDAGIVTFQSAAIEGQSALEHVQKASESESASLVFMSRDGKARFVGRTAVIARDPGPTIYGDSGTEIGYTDFVPDDGDEVIRNRALISRLDGVARIAIDTASITAFGPFDYVLEGLLQNSETESQSYANFVVAEYKNPRRRITSVSLGPPIAGLESTVYPAMLGPELGDVIRVRSRPVGGGALFEQVCAIEGIRASGAPGGVRMTTFTLSPEFTTI